ncbi:unnamed protein product [Phytomonas sp. EM1]|nr:unnamed protein product [Phytomonas sp. EM1]|eukprot:CCW65139.1 unnamed protein product [Phytomonas sp. isolate EM1]
MRCGVWLRLIPHRGPLLRAAAAVVRRAGGVPPPFLPLPASPPLLSRGKRVPPLSEPRALSPREGSLADFHPTLAQGWEKGVSNPHLRPEEVSPGCRKRVWWRCPHCAAAFTRRIDRHVAAGGVCPTCEAAPSTTAGKGRERERAKEREREREGKGKRAKEKQKEKEREGGGETLAEDANPLTRWRPMLARPYLAAAPRIPPAELIYASPKLDGIRCLAALDPARRGIRFFSRSGTLFECCEAHIAPALRALFARDPHLVLDGELYNDAANRASPRGAPGGLLRLLTTGLDGPTGTDGRPSVSPLPPIPFERLVSAVRTRNERCPPAVRALQARLQYHVFDLLNADGWEGRGAPCFTLRYARLRAIWRASGLDHPHAVVRVVPAIPCVRGDVEGLLRAALRGGYEGLMIRRDSLAGDYATLPEAELDEPQTTPGGKNAAEGGGFLTREIARRRFEHAVAFWRDREGKASSRGEGYAYGQRSGTLLKYKLTRDDEFVIESAVEGKGKWKGALGAFVCRTKDGRATFTVTPASSDAEKKRMWACWRTAYKGKALTVQYQELTADGIPRFPIGRGIRGEADGRDWI